MEQKRVEELLSGIEVIYVSNRNNFKKQIISSISTDTRSLTKGDFFVALKGEKYDANQFIVEAVRLGSSGILFEMGSFKDLKKAIEENPTILFIGVNDTLDVYSRMAKNYLNSFKSLKKLAITGSSGKTTMRGLIASILSKKYKTIASKKSFNNLVGVSKTIFSISNKHEFYIQEIGTNHPGEIKGLSDIVKPEAGIITNIGSAHIGYFGSIENIAKEKKALLLSLDENGTAFINKDDSFFNFLKEGIKAKVVTYGIKRNSDLEINKVDLDESIFIYKGSEIKLHLPGRHNILNALGAITVGTKYGIKIEEMRSALEGFKPEEGRGFVVEINGIRIIDESYNANPQSVKASVDYLSEIKCEGRKYFVLGDMAELGSFSEKYHKEVGNYVTNSDIDYVYLVGDKTYSTYLECKNRLELKVKHFYQISSLLEKLVLQLNKGDIVLIKGSRVMNLDKLVNGLRRELVKR